MKILWFSTEFLCDSDPGIQMLFIKPLVGSYDSTKDNVVCVFFEAYFFVCNLNSRNSHFWTSRNICIVWRMLNGKLSWEYFPGWSETFPLAAAWGRKPWRGEDYPQIWMSGQCKQNNPILCQLTPLMQLFWDKLMYSIVNTKICQYFVFDHSLWVRPYKPAWSFLYRPPPTPDWAKFLLLISLVRAPRTSSLVCFYLDQSKWSEIRTLSWCVYCLHSLIWTIYLKVEPNFGRITPERVLSLVHWLLHWIARLELTNHYWSILLNKILRLVKTCQELLKTWHVLS